MYVLSLSFGPFAGDSSGIRLSPNLIGLGLLEAIPEEAIRALADRDDVTGLSDTPGKASRPWQHRFEWVVDEVCKPT